MASSSKDQILQEEDISIGKTEEDIPRCSICISPISQYSTSNKCQQCLDKIDSIPTGFQFEIAGAERKEFECPICLCIIQNATELPCEHLMCKACLEHYEKERIEKSKREGHNEAEFSCSVCMTPYQVEKKTAVRSTDRMIQTTLKVKCLQKKCVWTGCIMDYEEHKSRHCNFVTIRCPYFDLGCLTYMERVKLPVHNQAKRHIHDSLLLTAVSAFTDERKGYHQKMDEQTRIIESLQGLVEDTMRRCENIEKHNSQLKQKAQKQDEVIKNLTQKFGKSENTLVKMRARMDNHDTDSLTKIVEIQNKEVRNLKTFAEQTTRLHYTLSHPDLNDVFSYMSPEDYETNNEITEWKGLIDEVTSKDVDQGCNYLTTLKDSIVRYQKTIYPSSWNVRLTNWRRYMEYGVNFAGFVKLFLYKDSRKFSLKVFKTTDEFDRTVAKSNKWCKHSNDTASYFDWKNYVLNVVMFKKTFEEVYVVNWEDGEKSKTIQTDGRLITVEKEFVSKGYILFTIF